MPRTKRTIKPAGFLTRAAAFSIDFAVSVGLGGTLAQQVGGPLGILMGAALVSVYFVVGWSGEPQSLGNSFLRITVIGTDGQYVGVRRTAVRFATLVAGALPVFIGWTAALSDEGRQAWHDKAAGTYVIESPFRNRRIGEWARLATGAEDWRPNPFAVAPQRRWPLALVVVIPILLAVVTWLYVLPFARLLATL